MFIIAIIVIIIIIVIKIDTTCLLPSVPSHNVYHVHSRLLQFGGIVQQDCLSPPPSPPSSSSSSSSYYHHYDWHDLPSVPSHDLYHVHSGLLLCGGIIQWDGLPLRNLLIGRNGDLHSVCSGQVMHIHCGNGLCDGHLLSGLCDQLHCLSCWWVLLGTMVTKCPAFCCRHERKQTPVEFVWVLM